jgi:hypothetical protein
MARRYQAARLPITSESSLKCDYCAQAAYSHVLNGPGNKKTIARDLGVRQLTYRGFVSTLSPQDESGLYRKMDLAVFNRRLHG